GVPCFRAAPGRWTGRRGLASGAVGSAGDDYGAGPGGDGIGSMAWPLGAGCAAGCGVWRIAGHLFRADRPGAVAHRQPEHCHGAADPRRPGQAGQLHHLGIFHPGRAVWLGLVVSLRGAGHGGGPGRYRGGVVGSHGCHGCGAGKKTPGGRRRGPAGRWRRPMRILLLVTGLQLGGAERQVVDLADRLAARGHVVAIAYLTGDAAVRPGAPVELYPLHFGKTPSGMLRGGRNLGRLVREWQPDVVHSHMVHANLIARVSRLLVPMQRLICTAHSPNEGGRSVMLAYRLTDRLADLSTHVSRNAVEAFERAGAVPRGRMLPVLNGIDLRAFASEPELRAHSRHR